MVSFRNQGENRRADLHTPTHPHLREESPSLFIWQSPQVFFFFFILLTLPPLFSPIRPLREADRPASNPVKFIWKKFSHLGQMKFMRKSFGLDPMKF